VNPEELLFTVTHEWMTAPRNNVIRIGISDYAQSQLGDIVFIETKNKGTSLCKGDTFGTIESTKSVSDLYSPVDGIICGINPKVIDEPEILNSDPYDEGWIIEIELKGKELPDDLMDFAAYEKKIQSED